MNDPKPILGYSDITALHHLWQTVRAPSLHGAIAGIAVGSIDQFNGYEDRGWNMIHVLHHHLDGLGVPILGGLPLGHLDDLVTIPLGATGTLDADKRELVVGSAVTE